MNDIPWNLLEKHFYSRSENVLDIELKAWLENAPENKLIYNQLSGYFKLNGSLPSDYEPDLLKAKEKIDQILFGKEFIKPKKFIQRNLVWKVASLLIIGSLSWWFIKNPTETKKEYAAVLFVTDSTQSNSIVLEDGSKIWLNSRSTIKYPKKFAINREVYLTGEAYFEIAHDSIHPFIVYAGQTQTKVIGTKFNIKESNTDNSVAINLLEGKVGFGIKTAGEIFLTPGQQAIFKSTDGSVVKKQNENPNFLSWKTYEFHFDSQPMETVMQNLADVYHFNYRFNSPEMKTRTLSASFLHRPLNEIFQTISLAAEVKISFENGKYFIQ